MGGSARVIVSCGGEGSGACPARANKHCQQSQNNTARANRSSNGAFTQPGENAACMFAYAFVCLCESD